MASVIELGDGRRRVDFVGPDQQRRSIRLGKIKKADARNVGRLLDLITAAAVNGTPIPSEAARWLQGLPEKHYEKLAGWKLVEARQPAGDADTLLGPFLDRYIENRTDVKGATRVQYRATAQNLTDCFGKNRKLESITPADADQFRRHLLAVPLALATVSRRCIMARTFFKTALRGRLISENPFADVKGGKQSNDQRQQYIPCDVVLKVMDAAPSAEWRLLIALSRFAGLRVPSEPFSLRWCDVLWDQKKLVVPVPKLEHLPGKETRIVPFLGDVEEHLRTVFDQAPEGAEFVFTALRKTVDQTADGWRAVNLGTQFKRIIKRAGCLPWPRLWHNMRASAQTDLQDGMTTHVVCKFLGNSPAVAERHYLQVTDEHFAAANSFRFPGTEKSAAKSAALFGGTGETGAEPGEPRKDENPSDFRISRKSLGFMELAQLPGEDSNLN